MFRSARTLTVLTASAAALGSAALPGTAAAGYGPSTFSFVSVNDATCKLWLVFPRYTQPSITFLKTTPAAGKPAAVRVDATFTKLGGAAPAATVALTTPGASQNVDLGRFGGWNADLTVTFADGSAIHGGTGFAQHGNPACSF